MVSRHFKLSGFVGEIGPDFWMARFDDNTVAEMTEPLPADAGEGSLFTIHRTKRGRAYVYWITEPTWTRRDVKKARQSAREFAHLFSGDDNGNDLG